MKVINYARFLAVKALNQNIRTYKTNSVRVRFAPSPTGYLHLGGLRTALYNYLYALSHNGKMILRIEDTDQSRKVEGALEALIENLEWAGIQCHEGPTIGGSHGPYIQSERINLYREHVRTLLDNKSAYKCFCTDRRLNLLRREANRVNQIPKYDNRCRHLTKDEIDEKIDKGLPHCIRFKLSSDCSTFDDLIYGSIAYDVTINEGDPVIMKSDGFPTYHFANVVDDHLMEISHVLRGIEWQISTTKHLLLYRAFGWKPPVFGHLPLIVNSDGTKLSKRQNDIRVEDYKKNGIIPSALINYITLTGGGFSRTPGEGIHHNTMFDHAQSFKLELVNCNPTRLNPELLTECNRLAIKYTVDENNVSDEVKRLVDLNFQGMNIKSDPDYVKSVLKWSSGRILKLEDLISPSLSFLWVLPDKKLDADAETLKLLQSLSDQLKSEDKFEQKHLKQYLRAFCKDRNVKFNVFMALMRNVLSGLKEGPGVAEMMEVLGKNATIERIDNVLK